MVEIGKPLHIRLASPLMAFLKLSGKAFLDGFRTCPPLQLLPVDVVPDLKVRQRGQGALKLTKEVVGIAGGHYQRCKRLLRGRAMGHGGSPLSGRQPP
jgi:hypothetical protein